MESIVRQLDIPRAQVMVEAAIVEVSGDITDALGVQWAIDARGSTGGAGGVNFGNTGISVGSVLNAINENEIPNNLPDGAIIGVGTRSFRRADHCTVVQQQEQSALDAEPADPGQPGSGNPCRPERPVPDRLVHHRRGGR